jgi:hypothetical protein
VIIGLPERFKLDQGGDSLRISWHWPKLAGVVLGVFAIAWDAFLVAWYHQALSRGEPSLVALIFPIGHVAAGFVISYLAAASLVNTTSIEVTSGELRIAHHPLPFPGNRTLRVGDIRQLFCVERTGRRGSRTFAVMARLASDREVTLISSLTSDREARFIEQRLESRLGLINQPVSGELAHQPR